MPSCLYLCFSCIFAWFLQPLILIFLTLWALIWYIKLRSISHLSTQSLQLLKSFCIIHLLLPKMVPALPMGWSPLCQCSSLTQQNEVPVPHGPQKQNLHLQNYCAAQVSARVFSVFCSCFWGHKNFPEDHVYYLLHNGATIICSAIPFFFFFLVNTAEVYGLTDFVHKASQLWYG